MATYTKETALYDTGKIATDIGNAANTANSYITTVSGTSGISVHNANDTNNLVNINSDGMTIYKGGTAAANKVAVFGDTATIGKNVDGSSRTTISGSGTQFIRKAGTNDVVLANIGYGTAQGEGVEGTSPYYTFGVRLDESHASEIPTYSTSTTYHLGDLVKYNSKAYICIVSSASGTWNATKWKLATGGYSLVTGYDNTAAGVLSQAHGDRCYALGNGSHAEGRLCYASGDYSTAQGDNCFTGSDTLGAFATGWLTEANYSYQLACGRLNSSTDGDLFEVGNGTSTSARGNAFRVTNAGNAIVRNNLTVGGHTTAIGSTIFGTQTTNKSISANSTTMLASATIPAGTWLLVGRVNFGASSSGYRRTVLCTTSGSCTIDLVNANMGEQLAPSPNGATISIVTLIVNLTSSTTYYLNGLSSVALTSCGGKIDAVRIA